MKAGLQEKFKNPVLAKKLIDTGDTELIEGNYWHDNFWGKCSCEKCKNKPKANTLGILLMDIRSKLQKGETP